MTALVTCSMNSTIPNMAGASMSIIMISHQCLSMPRWLPRIIPSGQTPGSTCRVSCVLLLQICKARLSSRRQYDHAAVDQDRTLLKSATYASGQSRGGYSGLWSDTTIPQVEDHGDVPERCLLRRPELWHRGSRTKLLWPAGALHTYHV